MLGPHSGTDRDGTGSLLVFFQVGTLRPPLGMLLNDDCASLPRRVDARPCKEDQESHNPAEGVEPFGLLFDVDLSPSRVRLLGALPPVSACRLDRCAAGIGEAPLEGFLRVTVESEEDEAAPESTGSNPFSSSTEMSLRLRGRIVEVVLLEGKRLSLLFIVAAAADKLDSRTLALETVDSQISTYQCNDSSCESGRRVCSLFKGGVDDVPGAVGCRWA
jgi:hypothetical protein